MKYKEFLEKLGLSNDQSTIYEYLLKSGPSPVRKISLAGGLKRGLCYKVIEQLLEKGLVEKINKKVFLFSPIHPEKIRDIADQKRKEVEDLSLSLSSMLGRMTSDWNLVSGKPSFQFFEGVAGIKHVYDEINFEKKDIMLIRSPFDNVKADFKEIIVRQLKKQVERNIKTRAITPIMPYINKDTLLRDDENLVVRRLIPKEEFMLPAQIIIYGEKVAITTFKGEMITTVIQDKNICSTFKIIFEFMWKKGKGILR